MSGHQAIAAVTATLQKILQAEISRDGAVGDGKVTSRPPDKARTGSAINQVNLFLYRTAIDPSWRNMDPPGIRPGETGQSPLPLVLSYVVTAYGLDDDELLAHRLLGIAMGAVNDNPVLARAAIASALPGSGLDTQLERVRVIPGPIPQDEISRMWSTFQTGYRISVTYDVSVVLIDSSSAATAPLPVLTRGAQDRGPQVSGVLAPVLTQISPSTLRPDPAQGLAAEFVLTGQNLGAVNQLVVRGSALSQPVVIVPDSVTDTGIRARVAADVLPAGTFGVLATTVVTGGTIALPTAEIPFALAPLVTDPSPVTVKLTPAGAATVTLHCAPSMSAGQTIALIIGDRTVPGHAVAKHPDQVRFALTKMQKGSYPIRLRVDRQDSMAVSGGRMSFQLLDLT